MIVFAIVAFLIFMGAGEANGYSGASRKSGATTTRDQVPIDEALASRTQINFVTQKEVKVVQAALERFYLNCGYFPDQLERLMESQMGPQNCKTPLREPALASTAVHRDLISRLNYTPYGYDDYELSLRLVWTRPNSFQ